MSFEKVAIIVFVVLVLFLSMIQGCATSKPKSPCWIRDEVDGHKVYFDCDWAKTR